MGISMDDYTALSQLEGLADKLGIPIRYEKIEDELTGMGGLCRIEGNYILIIHSKATVKEKIQILIEGLRRFDLGDIYVRPALRELLEEYEK
jgi:N-dimethylarginine dimethylaminohydrolase